MRISLSYENLTHLFREQVDVLFIAALWGIIQLDESQRLQQWQQAATRKSSQAMICIISPSIYIYNSFVIPQLFTGVPSKGEHVHEHTRTQRSVCSVNCVCNRWPIYWILWCWQRRVIQITWVVAVIDNTKVGTVEQLRFSRRPFKNTKPACYINPRRAHACVKTQLKPNNNRMCSHIVWWLCLPIPQPRGWPSCRRARSHGPPVSAPSPRSVQGSAGSPAPTHISHVKTPVYSRNLLPSACQSNMSFTTSISVLEWPMLQTIQPFFMRSSCSLVTTFLFPETISSQSGRGCVAKVFYPDISHFISQ